MKGTILLAAGGTGGHLFPAHALAAELSRRGYLVDLATDERAGRYGEPFPGRDVHVISSDTLRGGSPLALARTAMRLGKGALQSIALMRRTRPAAVVGFGGYPTFPPMFAAFLLRVPSVLHEANAVMGRANRMLAKCVDAVALGLPQGRIEPAIAGKTVQTGNPVRDAVFQAAQKPYEPAGAGEPFNLLVFGGSQGARFFSQAIPPALKRLPPATRSRLRLVMQCRAEDLEAVRADLAALGVTAELAPFYKDMAERIANAHLVVCRSGASSVTELAVIGRPSILVPFADALDNDQALNAAILERVGGAWPVAQKDLSPERFAEMLQDLMAAPERLSEAAGAARHVGKGKAVVLLADLVAHVAAGGKARDFRKGEDA